MAQYAIFAVARGDITVGVWNLAAFSKTGPPAWSCEFGAEFVGGGVDDAVELIHRLRSGVNRGATRDAEHEDAPNFPQPDLGMLVASPDITARAAAMASTVCFCRDLDVLDGRAG